MDHINGSSPTFVKMLDELRNLHKNATEIDEYIARLEIYMEQCCEVADVLQDYYIRRSQIEKMIHTIEHKINCEIIRSAHLVCA